MITSKTSLSKDEQLSRAGSTVPVRIESVQAHTRHTPHVVVEPVTTLLAKRYELKYRVPEATAVAIRRIITNYTKPDYYTLQQPSHQYSISSLYLDSKNFHLFQETELDRCNRFKLRIRTYDDNPDSPAFVEIKRKLNQIIYKSRVKIQKQQIKDVLKGYVPKDMSDKDRLILQQFMHYCQCLQAQPIVLIRYMREAFENDSESRVRITFDRQLSYQVATTEQVKVNGPGWSKLPINFVVLEIKFTDRFPSWLNAIVCMFNIGRQSMSKYCSSVKHFTQSGIPIPLK